MRTLELGTVSNGSLQSDDRRLLLLFASLNDCVEDASKITTNSSAWVHGGSMLNALVTVIHVENLPTVG